MSNHFALSPVDGRYAKQAETLCHLMNEHALIQNRVLIEIRWLQYLAQLNAVTECTALSAAENQLLERIITDFSPTDSEHIKALEVKTNHDVKAVEYFLQEKLKGYPRLHPWLHFGATSEDINNLAYALMLKSAIQSALTPRLEEIETVLSDMRHEYAQQKMLSRTHGQPATPTTVGKELANFAYRLQRQLKQLAQAEYLGKFNGAVGNFSAWQIAYPDIDWPAECQAFVESLGLTFNPYTTQIEPHDYIAELSHHFVRINTILIDLARDCWGYISLDYFKQKVVDHEIGSSTMPHKVNPIQFENAEGNLGVANSLLNHFANKLPISRFQRDLSDSTVLRYMGQALATCDIAYQSLLKGLERLDINPEKIHQDLQNHPEVITEAIQTVMRKHGINNAYEKLKGLSRGKSITQTELNQLINSLNLPDREKSILNFNLMFS